MLPCKANDIKIPDIKHLIYELDECSWVVAEACHALVSSPVVEAHWRTVARHPPSPSPWFPSTTHPPDTTSHHVPPQPVLAWYAAVRASWQVPHAQTANMIISQAMIIQYKHHLLVFWHLVKLTFDLLNKKLRNANSYLGNIHIKFDFLRGLFLSKKLVWNRCTLDGCTSKMHNVVLKNSDWKY